MTLPLAAYFISYQVFKVNLNSDSLWTQSQGTFTNMNIFGSVLSEEAMMRRTLGGDGCDSPGDYLRSVSTIYICFYFMYLRTKEQN